MDQKSKLFDKGWCARMVVDAPDDSWACDVVKTLDSDGRVYLDTLTSWFDQFPFTSEQHRHGLKSRLESLTTSDHLGAVNELCWYKFMCREDLQASPIPSTNAPRPDFKVTAPVEFFVEVSTLNVSQTEHRELRAARGVDLNHRESLRRVLLKAAREKARQVAFAASKERACLLVLFDYSFWSAFPTNIFRFLETALLGQEHAFAQLPTGLSAIAYVVRRISGGRVVISQRRSAIYHNPAAVHHLAVDTFDLFWQFSRGIVEREPKAHENWITL